MVQPPVPSMTRRQLEESRDSDQETVQALNFGIVGLVGFTTLIDGIDYMIHPAAQTASAVSDLCESFFDIALHGAQAAISRDAPWYAKATLAGLHLVRSANIVVGLAAKSSSPSQIASHVFKAVSDFYKANWIGKIFKLIEHAPTIKNLGDLSVHLIDVGALALIPSRQMTRNQMTRRMAL